MALHANANAASKSKTPLYICLILIANGFLKSLKFGEPYLTRYLRDFKGLTSNQVDNSVYPVWTFSYFAFLLPMSFLSPKLGYLYLIWIEAVMEIVTYAILTWGTGLWLMKAMQVTYGVSTAASFGYFMSVTALFERDQASKWNSFLRTTALVGHVVASLAAQLFVHAGMEMDWLFILSFICLCTAWSMTFFLPHNRQAHAEHAESQAMLGPLEGKRAAPWSFGSVALFLRQQLRIAWHRLRLCYGRADVLLWTFLWSTLYCYLLLCESYGSSLWTSVAERLGLQDRYNIKDVNGIMDAVGRGVGAFGSLAIAWIKPAYYQYHMAPLICIMGASTVVFGFCMVLLVAAFSNLGLVISAWTLCIGLGYSLTTMITGILALGAPKGHYGFMLGIQLLATMAIQTIIQALFSDTVLDPELSVRFYATAGLTAVSVTAFPILLYVEARRAQGSNLKPRGSSIEH